jgi:cytochrome c oxidase subunit 3
LSDSHATAVHAEHHRDPALLMQFDTAEQQKDVSQFGMWVFLITEIMFFGGLFGAYLIYRNLYIALRWDCESSWYFGWWQRCY